MRWLGRWAFNILAGLSLLLCVLSVALWVRSHSARYAVWRIERYPALDTAISGYWRRQDFGFRATLIYATRGSIRLDRVGGSAYRLYEPTDIRLGSEPPFLADEHWNGVLSFGYRKTSQARPFYSESRTSWLLPLWFPALLFLLPPLFWVVPRCRRLHRHLRGRCLACSYDLGASPERCPECGTPIAEFLPLKQVGRSLLSVLVVISSLLFVLAVLLWARSYRVRESIVWIRVIENPDSTRVGKYWRCVLGKGGIAFHFRSSHDRRFASSGLWLGARPMHDDFDTQTAEERAPGIVYSRETTVTYPTLTPDPYAYPTMWTKAGIQWVSGDNVQPWGAVYVRSLTLPLPLIASCSAILPLVLLARTCTLRLRKRAGFCPKCAYDLRATPESCPECGHMVLRPVPAS